MAAGAGSPAEGSRKIQHVVTIMQENHSSGSYFGTYPGANGIPAVTGRSESPLGPGG